MRIIAFGTDPISIHGILAHIGELTRPPPLALARDPPTWASAIDGGEVMDPEGKPAGIDALAQPGSESICDQRIACWRPLAALTVAACRAQALESIRVSQTPPEGNSGRQITVAEGLFLSGRAVARVDRVNSAG